MLHPNEEPDRPETCACGQDDCPSKTLFEHRVRTMEDDAGERYVNVNDTITLLGLILDAHQQRIQSIPVPLDVLPRTQGMLEGLAIFADWAANFIHSNVTHIPATIEVPDSVPTEWLTGGAAGGAAGAA